MKIQLIRNATLRLTFGDRLILVDPFLADKGTVNSFAGIAPNPTVDLPFTTGEVLANVEMVLVSHLHTDHFDATAQSLLPRDLPIYCQPGDEGQIAGKGFQSITPVDPAATWEGIRITRTPGQHGTGDWAVRMGKVSGFVLRAPGEPTLYWAGDTIWYPEVEKTITEFRPDVIVTHSSGARFSEEDDPIVMDAAQTVALCQAAPWAQVVAVHLEALDHCPVTRAALRDTAEAAGVGPGRLYIPDDGETIDFEPKR